MAILNGVRVSEFNPDVIADAIGGTWSKKWESILRLTVMKSHCFLSSKIVTESTDVHMDLPGHQSFYLQVCGSEGVRTVKIDTDESIDLTLNAGESVSAVFTLTK